MSHGKSPWEATGASGLAGELTELGVQVRNGVDPDEMHRDHFYISITREKSAHSF
jgi:hypothetical protein